MTFEDQQQHFERLVGGIQQYRQCLGPGEPICHRSKTGHPGTPGVSGYDEHRSQVHSRARARGCLWTATWACRCLCITHLHQPRFPAVQPVAGEPPRGSARPRGLPSAVACGAGLWRA